MNDVHFYRDLPSLKIPLSQLFREEYFTDVPPQWQLIISDVKNSTDAVAAGRHNDVNLVAAGSLIAALNVAKKHNVEVPFFFGGDGSTLLVPVEILQEVLGGLAAHNLNSTRHFGLGMHIGSMAVSDIMHQGHAIRISKMEIDSVYSKAVTIGSGMRYGEHKIKEQQRNEYQLNSAGLDLEGLECRWDKVKPAADEAENICYLIDAVETTKQLEVYADVMTAVDHIYGDPRKRHPLSIERLKPLAMLNFKKLRKEMMAKFGKWKAGYYTLNFVKTVFGALAFRYNWSFAGFSGNQYLSQLIAHADTLTIDGRINTIICGTPEKHSQFLQYLTDKEKAGLLVFGHHASKESIMTCYIENRNARHIHFVDGADGGYTEAAKELKAKLRTRMLVN